MKHTMTNPMAPTAPNSDMLTKALGYFGLAFLIAAFGAYAAPFLFDRLNLPSGFQWVIYITVLALSWFSHKWVQMPRPINFMLFTLLAFLLGFMVYPLLAYAAAIGGTEIIMRAFIGTALMSFAAGVYAKTTHRDLSGMGGFLFMAIIGLIIVSIINAFWFNGVVELIVSGAGILIFSALIAYEIQAIADYEEDRGMEAGIMLFIAIFNLFTSALRFLIALQSD